MCNEMTNIQKNGVLGPLCLSLSRCAAVCALAPKPHQYRINSENWPEPAPDRCAVSTCS